MIKSILITHRERPTDHFDIYYEVGRNKVTKIEEISSSPAPYCEVKRYAVFIENELRAEVKEPDVVEFYEEPLK